MEVLNGSSLSAERGDVISMIGASGSGKSTFLRCLNLPAQPSAGRIILAGEPLTLRRGSHGDLETSDPPQLRRLRSRVAMVFQQLNLWAHMTALHTVIEAPMQVLGLSHTGHATRRELSRARRCDPPQGRLSGFPVGGEQQRVAIARALAMEQDVMLFDAPTVALDPELVGEGLRVMRSLADDGRTMIDVTHVMGFARDGSNGVVFLHGRLIEEEGDPAAPRANPRGERLCGFLAKIVAELADQSSRRPWVWRFALLTTAAPARTSRVIRLS